MEIFADHKQISLDERQQIKKQVQADLIEHLYRGCLPGTIVGIVASVALFIDYYGHSPTYWLIAWIVAFNFMMVALSGLFFLYVNYKHKFSLEAWEKAYSFMMIGCSLVWIPAIILLPDDTTRQYLALIAFFLATTGYSTGTIGVFYLCVITLNVMLIPLTVWCFMRGGIFYNIVGAYTLIYLSYLIAANFRSTKYFKDSLRLKLENTLVSYQANHDFLTNLPNQRLLPQYINSAIRYIADTDNTLALVCFSLNRMEMIDDSLGHKASNLIIQAVTDRLNALATKAMKDPDKTQYILTISRKDTFNIIIVPTTLEQVDAKVKALFAVLNEPFYLEQKGVKLTASIGASIYKKDTTDAQVLLMNADAAMLRAKQYGGNRVEFYRTEITAKIPQQIEMEHDLHQVLQKNQLLLHYQPLVNIKTGQLCGMEALLRWKHPVHGYISPVHFIPLAEETGLIVPIGEWVLEEACRQTLIWHQMGFASLKVAVNLSEKQLRQENILDTVHSIILRSGFDPHFLELEITETQILDESVIPVIKEFKKMGLSLAVDDFGTGYSGLSYLKRFAIDKLKIDQSFIRDIPGNADSMTIVSAIIAMAKELKVHVLAEGVETKEQLQFLKSKGCEFVQGYYFSKPLEANYFTQLLLNQRSLAHQSD